jgi:DNA-binding MurR/RpiR family transcriptional regulator
MSSRTAIEQRLLQANSQLSPRRRRIIQATLESPDETCFLSSRALGRRYGVDGATIVRTIRVLGYPGYAEFLKDLRDHYVARLTPYQVMEATSRERLSVAGRVRQSLDRDLRSLDTLRSSVDPRQVEDLARRIHRARSILVVGVDLAASLAWFFAYGLMPLGVDAEAPVGSSGILAHKVRLLTRRDLVVAISFGRCLRTTVDTVLRARARSVPTFGITDSDVTPIARHCDGYLIAPVLSSAFTGSYTAPMALLNAVIVICAQLKPRRALALLRQTEKEYLSGSRWYETAPERRPKRT